MDFRRRELLEVQEPDAGWWPLEDYKDTTFSAICDQFYLPLQVFPGAPTYVDVAVATGEWTVLLQERHLWAYEIDEGTGTFRCVSVQASLN